MTRRVLSALLAAAALTAAGCGSTTDDVKSTVNGYLKAFVNGDGKKACSLMTKDTRTQFVLRVRQIVHTTDCAKAVATLRSKAGGQVAAALRAAKITKVQVSGIKPSSRSPPRPASGRARRRPCSRKRTATGASQPRPVLNSRRRDADVRLYVITYARTR